MRSFVIAIIEVCLLLVPLALGQGRIPLREFLFPPELVMRHQQELGLSDSQREQILSDMEESGSEFTRLRWNLEAEIDQLREMLETPKPDEAKVLEQLDEVLDLERQIKRTQLALAVRIKSVLNETQLEKLEELRSTQRRRFRPGGPPGPGGNSRPGGPGGGGPPAPAIDGIFP